MRVVVDTNVLVSGLAYPSSVPGNILWACQRQHLQLVLSPYIVDELVRVLPRLARTQLRQDELRDLASGLLVIADMVQPADWFDPDLRDGADQAVLATWRAAEAGYLITGDKDLLELHRRYPIVTPTQFWSRHDIA